ncbi:Protein of unknown function [Nocardioides scoriae]|uniref:DUF559 domain-containing protein n=1 Tax=Nocardioides scoriae TaxID=642780 RepID=A0A1H1MTN8_9ACTN|nr:DUF559 domain-containing protein [Nocardioides scoriae]SDR90243.1 Protein of unknown function [Nocardioides scoriae]
MSDAVRFLTQYGGFATWAQVVDAVGRTELDRAVRMGLVVWISRGRYGLPGLDRDVMTAHGLRGVLSHTSAARWHGWELRTLPAVTHVTLPRRRRAAGAAHVELHRADLSPEEVVDGICTSVGRTLVDCLRTLPHDAALTVGDSALRHGVDRAVLDDIGRTVRGRGSPGVLRVVRHADGRAANPFESCLRSIALQVEGLHLEPQHVIVGTRQTVRPDLVDVALQVALEADSAEWHSSRLALKRDMRRYNLLVADGWVVLRFAWEDVMFDPDYVLGVLRRVVDARTQVRRRVGRSA